MNGGWHLLVPHNSRNYLALRIYKDTRIFQSYTTLFFAKKQVIVINLLDRDDFFIEEYEKLNFKSFAKANCLISLYFLFQFFMTKVSIYGIYPVYIHILENVFLYALLVKYTYFIRLGKFQNPTMQQNWCAAMNIIISFLRGL